MLRYLIWTFNKKQLLFLLPEKKIKPFSFLIFLIQWSFKEVVRSVSSVAFKRAYYALNHWKKDKDQLQRAAANPVPVMCHDRVMFPREILKY